MMSSSYTAKGHEGGIIYSICIDVELACLAGLHQLNGILEGCRPVKSVLKVFTNQRAVRCMVPALTSMDLCEQLAALLPGNAPH
jgi:hypothetical protein